MRSRLFVVSIVPKIVPAALANSSADVLSESGMIFAPIPLKPGMILSNEPGFYLPGAYGIRLENLLLVQPADFGAQKRKFLKFETLTQVRR